MYLTVIGVLKKKKPLIKVVFIRCSIKDVELPAVRSPGSAYIVGLSLT